MEGLFVLICAIAVVLLVILGLRNRKRLGERDLNNKSMYAIGEGKIYESDKPDLVNRERFRTELSKAGFKDETIEDMCDKILDMKGSISLSDAIAIIRALDPIMKLKKDDT